MKAITLLTDALVDLGFVAAGETLNAEQAQRALRRANQWIDSLGLERRTIAVRLRTEKVLGANTQTYTIGTGGDINIARPTEIEDARLIIDTAATPPTEIPVEIFTDQRFAETRQKDLTSTLVRGIYYNHAWSAGLGQIQVWPVPTIGTTKLVLYTPLALTEFADLSTDYSFAPGYQLYFQMGVLEPLASAFDCGLTQVQVTNITKANVKLKRANSRPKELRCDSALVRGNAVFNWKTGE